jgi:hypothetical protein
VWCGVETGPQPVAWHPAGTVSSETGVPPSRGRPPEQPRGPVVLPTRPPPQVRGRREPGRHTRHPSSVAEAVRPEPGTARPRHRSCSTLPGAFRGTPDFHPHARDRRYCCPGKIELPWCRSRPCGWWPLHRHEGVIVDSARNPSECVGFRAESEITGRLRCVDRQEWCGSDISVAVISVALTPLPPIMASGWRRRTCWAAVVLSLDP